MDYSEDIGTVASVTERKATIRLDHRRTDACASCCACSLLASGDAVVEVDPQLIIPIIYGPKGEALAVEAMKRGVRVVRKFFGDRAYTKDGNLANRKLPRSVIHDPAEVLARVIRMIKEKKVKTIEGTDMEMTAPSIMMHGDTPEVVDMLKTLRQGLEAEGIKIVPMSELV